MTELTIAERVDAGWALMEKEDPGWWRADAKPPVILRELDMSSPGKCILGQRCPLEARAGRAAPYFAYAYSLAEVEGDADEGLWDNVVNKWAADRGFTARPSIRDDSTALGEFLALGAEWKRRILERRAA